MSYRLSPLNGSFQKHRHDHRSDADDKERVTNYSIGVGGCPVGFGCLRGRRNGTQFENLSNGTVKRWLRSRQIARSWHLDELRQGKTSFESAISLLG